MTLLDHTEKGFEDLIVDHLSQQGGWLTGHSELYSRDFGLFPGDLIGFIGETQPKAWQKLVTSCGGAQSATDVLCKRVAARIDKRGTVAVLREGVEERGIRFRLAYFRPALTGDQKAVDLYAANRATVVRQVHHDAKKPLDSLDLVLFVNGIPTATCELKNKFSATGWDVDEAMRQYREDRDPANVLLGKRAIVHFALDSELAYMTTRLAGESTRFLPFNQGSGGAGQYGGKGNPSSHQTGHPTAYVWEQVWQRDAWLELLDDFVYDEGKVPGVDVVFPRYHQWDVVRRCGAHARDNGPGHNYLIQHSAGSGKTKEIAWLAHDLSSLHNASGEAVFSKVIVITDRRVLDAQLQRQVRAFAQTQSAVVEIDENSQQLLDALTGTAAQIIITTLQKFPIVLQKIAGDPEAAALKERSYAVIVDEAHSSQSGDAAKDVKAVIGNRAAEDLDLDEHETDGVPLPVLATMAARGQQPNISYFAFTATPKGRTLELFGQRTGAGPDASYGAFHTYSMRQAIEEGFILDVLRNYTTYTQLFKLEASAADQELPKGKARSKIAAYAKFHPYSKDQKAKVVIDHYRQVARPHLHGEAKAMVVTSSREEAVRWKQALDRHVKQEGVDDVLILVAFSGEVEIADPAAPDAGAVYSEPEMNTRNGKRLSESRLPGEFDKPEYGVLVVAEKYQTGFDQPKLVAMYVDKPLSGINAVQTLSRLNRVHPAKEETYVLDFVNDGATILAAFEQYFGATEALPSDPNVLADAAQQVRDWDVVLPEEVDSFAEIYRPDASHHELSARSQGTYAAALELDEDDRSEFRSDLDRFVRFYKFLSQIVPYLSVDHEKLFQFSRFLALRLQTRAEGGVSVADSIELTHYRLVEGDTENLGLDAANTDPLSAISGDGTGAARGPEVPMGLLGELVEVFNERFGLDLSDEDAIRPIQHVIETAEQIGEAEGLKAQVLGNSFEDVLVGKEDLVIKALLQVQNVNETILPKLLDDDELRERMTALMVRSIYDKYTGEASDGARRDP